MLMKKFFLALMIALAAIPVFAQEPDSIPTQGSESQSVINQNVNTFTRGKGFFARPEVFGGFFLNGGYQFSPYFQASLGAGITIDPVFVVHGGVRVYTGVKKWAGMFDYHVGFCNYSGYFLTRHTLIGGASYKDLDFGAGIHYLTLGGNGVLSPAISIGWNIRFYKHR